LICQSRGVEPPEYAACRAQRDADQRAEQLEEAQVAVGGGGGVERELAA
tara:strand:+ start:297 stop:443 length:147 start_codon:yes stop_codon:yes gene_type:complete